jgi:hypothetical protein
MANFFIATVNESSAEVKVFFLKKRKSTLGTITGQSSVYYRKKGQNHTCSPLFLSIYSLQDFAFRDIIIPTEQDFEGENTGRHEFRI